MWSSGFKSAFGLSHLQHGRLQFLQYSSICLSPVGSSLRPTFDLALVVHMPCARVRVGRRQTDYNRFLIVDHGNEVVAGVDKLQTPGFGLNL